VCGRMAADLMSKPAELYSVTPVGRLQ